MPHHVQLLFAYYFLSWTPTFGCCVDAPHCPAMMKPMHDYRRAPTSSTMDREDEGMMELNSSDQVLAPMKIITFNGSI